MEWYRFTKHTWYAVGLTLLQGVIIVAAVACEGDGAKKKKEDRSAGPSAPADERNSLNNQSVTQKVEFEDPSKLPEKISVKAYHLLVKEGPKDFSGYCIALSRDPKLGTEATDTIVVKQGGCPTALTIKGKSSPMSFVCNPVELTKDVTQQVVLYSQLETGGSYKDIKTLSHDIILAFCTNPQAT
jgi:flagella basal body P-ring formation protein FlgA